MKEWIYALVGYLVLLLVRAFIKRRRALSALPPLVGKISVDQLRTGDLLLMRCQPSPPCIVDSIVSPIIIMAIENPIHHTGMVYVTSSGRKYVWEMRGRSKGAFAPLEVVQRTFKMYVRQLEGLGKSNREVRGVLQELGREKTRFNYMAIFEYAAEMRRRKQEPGRWKKGVADVGSLCCSQFTAETYRRLGVFRKALDVRSAFPADFASGLWNDAILPLRRGHSFGPILEMIH